MHGPTCIFWANLTSFSLEAELPLCAWTHVAYSVGAGGDAELYINGRLDSARRSSGQPVFNNGSPRARSHCRVAPPLIHFMPESLTCASILMRQCDRTVGSLALGAHGKFGGPRSLVQRVFWFNWPCTLKSF